MANHPSALKRHRQSLKKNERNRFSRSTVRSATKSFLTAVSEEKKEDAETGLKTAVRQISKATSKNVLKKKTASRKISRLSKKLNTLKKS